METIRKYKYFAAFLSAWMLDLWFDMCAYAANHKEITLAVCVNLTYPLISMMPIILVVEEKTLKEKAKIAVVEGFGYVTGILSFFYLRDKILFLKN